MNKNQLSNEIYELYVIYHNSNSKNEFEEFLRKIKSEKDKFDKNSFDYLNLLHLECITRQRIQEIGLCPIEEIFPNLNKALECTLEIQKICEELNNYHTLCLASMQEATCILTELSRFDESADGLTEIIELQEFIRNSENADNQLIYLSYMNEAKIRLELANKNIDSKNNCLLSLRMSEKSRNYYKDGLNYYEVTYQNQLHALSLLSIFEDYGFEIEMKEALKKLNNKVDKDINLYNFQIDAELVELGIEDVEKLDEILEKIPQARNELYPEENTYKQFIIFEGELLIRKAKFSENFMDKITYLNQSIDFFNNHLEFDDNYYNAQSLFNIGYAKLQLSKLIQEKKNLSQAQVRVFSEILPLLALKKGRHNQWNI